ncbi:MAG: cytochrome c [Acidobacteriota bacterium]
MRTLRLLVVAVVKSGRLTCVISLLTVSTLQAQSAVSDGNEQNGKRLFTAYYCTACHGTMGQGGAAGARIAPRPIAFAAFQKYLRQPTGQMAPYTRGVLADRDLADIYAFLQSIPSTPASKDIPLLGQ